MLTPPAVVWYSAHLMTHGHLAIDVAAGTDKGCVRANNEDSFRFLTWNGDFWAAVADGCGGEAAGEVASQLAVDVFAEQVEKEAQGPRDLPFVLRDAVARANAAILEYGKREGHAGMGTTFTAVYCRGGQMISIHAGDSRIYRLRAGVFTQLTEDHTWVQEQVKAGRMTPDQAENDPRGSVLMKALGAPDFPVPDMDFHDLQEGDSYLLASDGLHRVVTMAEVADRMSDPPAETVKRLIALSIERGAPDNVTVIAFRVLACG